MAFNFPIDMIYLWCDGSDPSFQKRKRKYLNEGGEIIYLQEIFVSLIMVN